MVEQPLADALGLDPIDWFLAPWRRLSPLPQPAVTPFDLATCVERLGRIRTPGRWDWDGADLAPALSREEARFWYEAMTQAGPEVRPRTLAMHLSRQFVKELAGQPLARRDVVLRLKRHPDCIPPHIVLALVHLLTPANVVELASSDDLVIRHNDQLHDVFRRGIQHFLIPYISPETHVQVRDIAGQRMREMLDAPRPGWLSPVVVAALFGLHDEMDAVVRLWRDNHFHGGTSERRAQWVVFGLGSVDLVRHHMRRLGLRLNAGEHVRAWLAHTELGDLDWIRDSVLACTQKPHAEELVDEFARIRSPLAAPYMLELKLQSRAPGLASRWLEADPARTACGLATVAAGRGKLATAALELLRDLARAGHGEVVDTHLHDASPRVRQAVTEPGEPASTPFDEETTPDWLRQAVEEQLGNRPGRLAAWIVLEHLPPIRIGNHHLAPRQVHAAINALKHSTFLKAMPLVTLLKEKADPVSLDAFVWELCTRWLERGAASQDRWALTAVGLWGGDASAVKLATHIRAWPGQRQARRALAGLEVLRAIGSDTALMELSSIARKVRFRKLQQTATGFMYDIASERGLSPARLEDRIVPDLGLDERGTRVFDFGPRQFELLLSRDLKPMIRDSKGAIRADLPKPTGKDDKEKEAEAQAAWKLIKKQLRDLLSVQSMRLESAMLTQRVWSVSDFHTYLVRHPVMGLLAQRLLWTGRDERGRPVVFFRVNEDRICVSRDESPCRLNDLSGISLVHPLHLDDVERQVWQEVFADHEIVPPFAQLGRERYTLQPGEEKQTVLRRVAGLRVPAAALAGVLEKHGWDRGRLEGWAAGNTLVREYVKYFPAGEATGVIRFRDGLLPSGFPTAWPDQTLEECYIVAGLADPQGGVQTERALPLGEVDPIILYEVLAVLQALADRAA